MEGSEYLYTIAEVSIAVVGFSAVVVVFRRRGGEALSQAELELISFMIERGFAALFLSLLPMLLSHIGVPTAGVWTVSSGALALYLVIALIRTAAFRWRLPSQAEAELPGRGLSFLLVCGVVLVIAVQVLNAFDVVVEQSVGWYLLGVTSVLGLAAIIFGTIIRAFVSSDGGAA